jgi:hypothetical protein
MPVYETPGLSLTDVTGAVIDVGQFATPQAIDVNNDGLRDLVIGHKNGGLRLFTRCVDGAGAPAWCPASSPTSGLEWGGILVDNALGINGYSVPALYTADGTVYVFVANELGRVQYFGTVNGADWLAPLPEVSSSVLEDAPGLRGAAALADLDGDGLPEWVLGIQNGGLRFYAGTVVGIAEPARPAPPTASDPSPLWQVVPNPSAAGGAAPASLLLRPAPPTAVPPTPLEATLLTPDGRTLRRALLLPDGPSSYRIPSELHPALPGLYLLRWQFPGAPAQSVRWVIAPE